MERKLKPDEEPVSITPIPQFEEPVLTIPVVIRGSTRHPETGVLCFSAEEWEAEDKKVKEKNQ